MTPIQQLKIEYAELAQVRRYSGSQIHYSAENYYKGMRTLCLNCSLVSLIEIEQMENEIEKNGNT